MKAMIKHIRLGLSALTAAISLPAMTACTKGFLDEKPRSELVVPASLDDYERLLNNQLFHYTYEMPELLADDYYLERDYWQGRPEIIRNAHTWSTDPYGATTGIDDWARNYTKILYANVVLEGLSAAALSGIEPHKASRLKGEALFQRGYALFQLAGLFSGAYGDVPGQDDAIPVPMSSDVYARGWEMDATGVYERIVADLRAGFGMLPAHRDPFRPTAAAAAALLCRVYLGMGDFAEAKSWGLATLGLHDALVDYNDVTVNSRGIHHGTIYLSFINSGINNLFVYNSTNVLVSPVLYGLYGEGDLRKTLLYRANSNGKPFRGPNYFVSTAYPYFTGLSTEEAMLGVAECLAREGDAGGAARHLNRLLMHRYAPESFEEVGFSDGEEALRAVLIERRKELAFRGLRWGDLRRFNGTGEGRALTRVLGEETFVLRPGDRGWIMPIPPTEGINR